MSESNCVCVCVTDVSSQHDHTQGRKDGRKGGLCMHACAECGLISSRSPDLDALVAAARPVGRPCGAGAFCMPSPACVATTPAVPPGHATAREPRTTSLALWSDHVRCGGGGGGLLIRHHTGAACLPSWQRNPRRPAAFFLLGAACMYAVQVIEDGRQGMLHS